MAQLAILQAEPDPTGSFAPAIALLNKKLGKASTFKDRVKAALTVCRESGGAAPTKGTRRAGAKVLAPC